MDLHSVLFKVKQCASEAPLFLTVR